MFTRTCLAHVSFQSAYERRLLSGARWFSCCSLYCHYTWKRWSWWNRYNERREHRAPKIRISLEFKYVFRCLQVHFTAVLWVFRTCDDEHLNGRPSSCNCLEHEHVNVSTTSEDKKTRHISHWLFRLKRQLLDFRWTNWNHFGDKIHFYWNSRVLTHINIFEGHVKLLRRNKIPTATQS